MNFFVVFAVIGMVGFILLLYMMKEAFTNRIVNQEFSFREFPESFAKISLFFISDIHHRKLSAQWLKRLNGKVDYVIIGGDLTERGVPFSRVSHNICLLTELAPTFFVWGNNDHEVNTDRLRAILLENDVNILENKSVQIQSKSGDLFFIIGVDDVAKYRDRIELALSEVKEEGFKLLVSHNPEIVHKLIPENNIQLILSGHTHGGQIRILGYGPYEMGGIKRVGKSVLLVSNGFGTTGIPLRLGAKAQTHFITIKHCQEN